MDVYVDDRKSDLLTVERHIPDVGHFKIAVVGRPSHPALIRTELVGADKEGFNEVQAWEEARLVEHLLSVYRLTTDQQIEYLWLGHGRIWLDTEGNQDETKPRFSATISPISDSDYEREMKNARLLFERTIDHQPLFKLLSDSQQPHLPISYRYLSIYKALELEFKVGKKWPTLGELLARFEDEYRALNISNRTLENYIHEVRDLCAHIKLDNSDTGRGITGLESAEYPRVERLFYLLKNIAFQHLTTKFPVTVNHPPDSADVSESRVTAPEVKARLEGQRKLDKAAKLHQTALVWEQEARGKDEAVSKACLEFARQARFLAGLFTVRGVV
ncbi:hypothetical protein [Bradyrhizobium sp. CCBAU 53415]|uniref:hypothetical protein n=1 Tax=Bradyrhizobium sp. CCBAU 53415 TaxID=1325119 RepID=UPI0023055652|nr:hypothetical protein [Bradyrhizobium sp. CCBAU 53415]